MTLVPPGLSSVQQVALVVLRTLIGWHFAYEGYFKLLHPAWSRGGAPLERFSSIGYLRNAAGPMADLFHWLARPEWIPYIDTAVAVALLAAGLMLMLGLLTQLGCALAIALLSLFYLSALPFDGLPQPRAEGTYLIVNKNLIEAVAVGVLMAFRTGRIAGFDALRGRSRRVVGSSEPTGAAGTERERVKAARRGAEGPADTL
jgi:thiosulfate dehydrogenase [quinone] large subunit